MTPDYVIEYRIQLAPSGLWEFSVLYGGTLLHFDAENQTWLAMQEIANQFSAAMTRLVQECGG